MLVLVCPSTVEEVILEATERKLSLDAKVIQAGLFNEASTAADRQKALQQVLQTNPPPQFGEYFYSLSSSDCLCFVCGSFCVLVNPDLGFLVSSRCSAAMGIIQFVGTAL